MKLKTGLIGLAAALLLGGVANAGTLRVVVVEASDVGAYVKALEDGKALLKKKGSPAELHVWLARYAGPRCRERGGVDRVPEPRSAGEG